VEASQNLLSCSTYIKYIEYTTTIPRSLWVVGFQQLRYLSSPFEMASILHNFSSGSHDIMHLTPNNNEQAITSLRQANSAEGVKIVTNMMKSRLWRPHYRHVSLRILCLRIQTQSRVGRADERSEIEASTSQILQNITASNYAFTACERIQMCVYISI